MAAETAETAAAVAAAGAEVALAVALIRPTLETV